MQNVRFLGCLIILGVILSCQNSPSPGVSFPYGCYQSDFGFFSVEEVGQDFEKVELEIAANSNTFRFRFLDKSSECSKFLLQGRYTLDSSSVRFHVEKEYSVCDDLIKTTGYFSSTWRAEQKREGREISLCFEDCSLTSNWRVFVKEPYDNANCVNSVWID